MKHVEVAPYWNVNYSNRAVKVEFEYVEVAPYWNVNGQRWTPYKGK